MKTIILGGFLGSGKTTVLLQLAKYITGKPDFPQVVILENEIGEVGVDNEILEGAALAVESVFSGCICCTGAVDLIDAVQTIESQYEPDWLIVEATGMAQPSSIQTNLKNILGLDSVILAIADASRWSKLMIASPVFVRKQLEGSGLVLLTKTDKTDADALAKAYGEVKECSGGAKVYPVCALDPISENIFEELMDKAE
ncbi:MAG: cobalamin biosynthesis protein P47K [Firmicutes bacterium]|nr:cobalamin biosynthesis protein P47K [Bacillota bacterium]